MVIALTHYLTSKTLECGERRGGDKRGEVRDERRMRTEGADEVSGEGGSRRCDRRPPSWNTEATWETTGDITRAADFRGKC